jgi:hypothetical protein
MPVYVAEISGRGVIAFDAPDDLGAKARLAHRGLLRDIRVFQNNGRPLWDGVSAINLRGALPEEIATWQARRMLDDNNDENDDDTNWRVFLVSIVDPSRFGDEDDGEDLDHDD